MSTTLTNHVTHILIEIMIMIYRLAAASHEEQFKVNKTELGYFDLA